MSASRHWLMLCLLGVAGAAAAQNRQQHSQENLVARALLHGTNSSAARRSLLQRPRQLYKTPAATLSVKATLELNRLGLKVPQSFLGLSCEWVDIDMLGEHPEYISLLQKLSSYGTGPLSIRIGGGSTDMQTTVPGANVWKALSDVQYKTGVNFILGLNFMHMDIELARRQMNAALGGLPRGSITSFELGNEPNYYVGVHGKSPGEYTNCCLVADWMRFAQALSCPGSSGSCTRYQLAGPAWGHITMKPDALEWFLRSNWLWTNMVTIHWYKATSEKDVSAENLLDEAHIRSDMNALRQVIAVATTKWNKPLRVAEMNSISNSGKRGVSDVFSAALWTLDGALEVAFTGAVGVNVHQGSGHNLYSAYIRPGLRPAQAPYVRPPFYAYLMLQMALRGGSQFVGKIIDGPSDKIKVHPLQDTSSGALRIIVINKTPNQAATTTLRVSAQLGSYGTASVTRMVAAGDNPLETKEGITIGGQTYGHQGATLMGDPVTERVAPVGSNGMITWTLYMPPASAALLEIPKQ